MYKTSYEFLKKSANMARNGCFCRFNKRIGNINNSHRKYRLSKRIKYRSKIARNEVMKHFYFKSVGLVDLLVRLGVHKNVFFLKLMFVIMPFAVLCFTNNTIIAMIIATIDIFCCAFLFSMTTTERYEAIIDGSFDYGKYKYIKARKEVVAILFMFFIAVVSILIGHFFNLENFIQSISGIAKE